MIYSFTIISNENEISFTVTTDVFAHAVHFGLGASAKFSDQYFDLLPGESRRITLSDPGHITANDIHPQSIYLG